MSVTSDDSEVTETSAHCGGHDGTASKEKRITEVSCVYGSGPGGTTADYRGASTHQTGVNATVDADPGAVCDTARSLGRPGAGPVIT